MQTAGMPSARLRATASDMAGWSRATKAIPEAPRAPATKPIGQRGRVPLFDVRTGHRDPVRLAKRSRRWRKTRRPRFVVLGKEDLERMQAWRSSVAHVSRITRNNDIHRPGDTPLHRFRYTVPVVRSPVVHRRASPRLARDTRHLHGSPTFHSSSDSLANSSICTLSSIVLQQNCLSNPDAPALPGPLQPLSDLCLVRCLRDNRSDRKSLPARIVISHPVPVYPEVVQHPRQIIPLRPVSRPTSQTADGPDHPIGPVRIVPQHIFPLSVPFPG